MTIPATPLITAFNQIAPNNSRGVENPPLYDTNMGAYPAPSGTLVYVDATTGNDSNAGTSGSPWLTIGHAISTVNGGGVDKTIVLKSASGESHFRESIGAISGASHVVGIVAAVGAKVWIKGSDVITGFTHGGGGWQWNTAYNPPLVDVPGSPLSDQVFLDGVPLIQSLSPNPPVGQFYVDKAANHLFLGSDPTGRTVEATMRGYLCGGGAIAKAGFVLRGVGIAHFSSDFTNDVNAMVRITGSNQFFEYCVLAYSGCVAIDASASQSLTMTDIVVVNSGALCMHTYQDHNLTATRIRFDRANWEQGYDITPSPTERIGGVKQALSFNATWDQLLIRNCHCNAFWVDVGCVGTTVTRFSAIDNFCYGLTAEVGDTLFLADALFLRNGNTTFGNRDGFRSAGTSHCEIANVTSIDNVGAAFGCYEDARTYSNTNTRVGVGWAGGTATAGITYEILANGKGDQFDTKFYNNVLVNTSRATRAVLASYNYTVHPGGANQLPQDQTFQTEQMFSSNPNASPPPPLGHHNTWMRLSTSQAQFQWATPGGDFNKAKSVYQASTNLTLAQVQARAGGPEQNSLAIDDNGAAITKYFPSAGSNNFSWKTLATIPGTGTSTTGAVPSARVAAVLGLGAGVPAHRGCYNPPLPVVSGANTAPYNVTVASPTAGTTVSGNSVTIVATASDAEDNPIALVEFLIDGVVKGTLTPGFGYAGTWDSTTAANGSRTITVRATDSGGLSTTSPGVAVTVSNGGGDTTAPVVSIGAPTSGQTLSGTVAVVASVTDNVDNPVAYVRLLVDEVDKMPLTPGGFGYVASWDTTKATNGAHTVKVRARDAAGNTTTTSGVNVTVANGGGNSFTFRADHDAVGWNVPRLSAGDTSGRTAVWTRVADSGARIVRTDAYWSAIQPTNSGAAAAGLNDTGIVGSPSTELTNLNAFVDDAAAHGCHVWLTCAFTPNWANGNAGNDKVPPSRQLDTTHYGPDYANFCWLIADHFATRNPGVVVAIGVWNEPNTAGFWAQPAGTGTTGGTLCADAPMYARLLIGAYNAVKNGVVSGRSDRTPHPEMIVTSGPTAPAGNVNGNYLPLTFVQSFCDAGATNSFDHLDHHPYCWALGPEDPQAWNPFQQMHALLAELDRRGRGDANIWTSEIGCVSRPDDSGDNPATEQGVGGFDAGAVAPAYNTSTQAISYTLAEYRLQTMFDAWRSAEFYDIGKLRHRLGPMVWFQMFDEYNGIHTDWPLDPNSPYPARQWWLFYGFYEWGTTQWDGVAKGDSQGRTMIDFWSQRVVKDTTGPTGVAIISPAPATLAGVVPIVVSATDDRDGLVENVSILLDGNVLGQCIPGYGYALPWDTTTVADGVHTLAVAATDNAGNTTRTADQHFTVQNNTIITPPPPPPSNRARLAEAKFVVFCRDLNFNRTAQVDAFDKLDAIIRYNAVGAWTLDLGDNTPAATELAKPGAGIVVERDGDVIFAGPVLHRERKRTSDGDRTLSLAGADDNYWLKTRVAKPEPFTPTPPYSNDGHDVRTGPASSIIIGYVDANLGPAATSDRQLPVAVGFAADPFVGASITRQARYDVLLDFITEIGQIGGCGFRLQQQDNQLVFTAYAPRDLRRAVVYAIEIGNIGDYTYSVDAPDANFIYVAGQGQDVARSVVESSDASSIIDWSRIESFLDQRQEATDAGLYTAALAELVAKAAKWQLDITPVDLGTLLWAVDWDVGDMISVIVDGVQLSEQIREVELTIDKSGARVVPRVGTGVATNPRESRLFAEVAALKGRLAVLETI